MILLVPSFKGYEAGAHVEADEIQTLADLFWLNWWFIVITIIRQLNLICENLILLGIWYNFKISILVWDILKGIQFTRIIFFRNMRSSLHKNILSIFFKSMGVGLWINSTWMEYTGNRSKNYMGPPVLEILLLKYIQMNICHWYFEYFISSKLILSQH